MKIKNVHYSHMLGAISTLDKQNIKEHFKWLKTQENVKDINKRLRWDAFFAAGLSSYASRTLYTYLNDDHIDTALKNIAATLRFPTE